MAKLTLSFFASIVIFITVCLHPTPALQTEPSISCCSSTETSSTSNQSHCKSSIDFSADHCNTATASLSNHPSCLFTLNSASTACNIASHLHIRLAWPDENEDDMLGLAVGDIIYLVPKLAVSMCDSLRNVLQSNVGEYTVVEDSVALNGELAEVTMEFEPQVPGALELCRLRGTELVRLQVSLDSGQEPNASNGIRTHCPADWFYAAPDLRSNSRSPSCRGGSSPSCAFATFKEDISARTWFESAEFCHSHGIRQCSVEEVLADVSREVFPGRIQSGRLWTSSRCSYLLEGVKHFGFYTRALHPACASPDCDTSHPNSYPGERCWHDGSKRLSCESVNGGRRGLRHSCPENTDWRLFLKNSRNDTVYDFFAESLGEGSSVNIPVEKLPGQCMSGASCGTDSSHYTVVDGGLFSENETETETAFTSCANFNISDVAPPALVNGLKDELTEDLLVRHGAIQLECSDEFAGILTNNICCSKQVPSCELCPFGLSSMAAAQHVSECTACVRQCGHAEACECEYIDRANVLQQGFETLARKVSNSLPDTRLQERVTVDKDVDGTCPPGTYPSNATCLYCAQGFESVNGSACVLCAEGCVECGRVSQCRCSSEGSVAARRLSSCESLLDQTTCEDTVACAWSEDSCYTMSAPENGCEVLLKDFKCDAYTSCVWDESASFCKVIGIPTSGCSAKTTSAKCTKFSLCSWTGSLCEEISPAPSSSPSEPASSAPSTQDISTAAPSLTPDLCATYQSELDCDGEQYCEWDSSNSICLASGQPSQGCAVALDEASCSAWSGCWWDSSACVDQPTDQPVEGCEVLLKEDKCNGYTECIWFDNQCMIIGNPTNGCSAKSTDAKCNKFYLCTWSSGACTDVERTVFPTDSPSTSMTPTNTPSSATTMQPTVNPSQTPTEGPTKIPTLATAAPVAMTSEPTVSPSVTPFHAPTSNPSMFPSNPQTESPSVSETGSPRLSPTYSPVTAATEEPSSSPTLDPTRNPSRSPSSQSTNEPSLKPTSVPTSNPSGSSINTSSSGPSPAPSRSPSSNPSARPATSMPSATPSEQTHAPSESPSSSPSLSPVATLTPTSAPSVSPSSAPSISSAPTTSPLPIDLNETVLCRCTSECVKGRCEVQSISCLLSQPWLAPTFVAGGVGDTYGFFVPNTPVAWCDRIPQSAKEMSPGCQLANATVCPSLPYAYVKEADVMVTRECEVGQSCNNAGGDGRDILIRGERFQVSQQGRDPLAVDTQCP